MRILAQAIGGGGAAIAAFLLLVGPINLGFNGNPALFGDSTGAGTGDTSDSPSGDPTDGDDPDNESETSCSTARRAANFLYNQGFAERNFVVGANAIDWSLGTGHVDDPFTKPLRTERAVNGFIGSDRASARAARSIADDSVIDYVVVQFRTPIEYSGNWYWTGRKAVEGGDRKVKAGDVWWLAMDDDCSVLRDSSIRAICGNVGFDLLQPAVRKD